MLCACNSTQIGEIYESVKQTESHNGNGFV